MQSQDDDTLRSQWRAFDALHDDPAAWHGRVLALARQHGGGQIRQATDGTVMVAMVDHDRVIKLYPPFLRDHFDFECEMLRLLEGRLSVPTPRLLSTGEHIVEQESWPYLIETQLSGQPMTASWPTLSEPERCALLGRIGELTAEVHALPSQTLQPLAPRWDDFIKQQKTRCLARQQRNGLPDHLLQQLPQFIEGPLPSGPPLPVVPLTGEYTPFNLFTHNGQLAAMFDFGDGLVGPREYDWLGPLCFMAAGHADRVSAYFKGYGAEPGPDTRAMLLRLLLLHRYSNPPRQIASSGWQQAADFEAVAQTIWP